MIAEDLDELLSRALDDDLAADEVASLAARLAAEPELAARSEELARWRGAVAAVAARDEVPRRLDLMMEPLRREAHGPRRRPMRWLAAAAAVAAAAWLGLHGWRPATPPPGGPSVAEVAAEAEHGRSGGRTGEDRSPLRAALHRGRLPAMPLPGEPPALDVIGPLPFPPDVYGGRIAVLDLPDDVTIPLRVPASCPPGVHAVLATSSGGGHSELRLSASEPTALAGCTPLVVLDPVPANLGPTPARLVVARG